VTIGVRVLECGAERIQIDRGGVRARVPGVERGDGAIAEGGVRRPRDPSRVEHDLLGERHTAVVQAPRAEERQIDDRGAIRQRERDADRSFAPAFGANATVDKQRDRHDRPDPQHVEQRERHGVRRGRQHALDRREHPARVPPLDGVGWERNQGRKRRDGTCGAPEDTAPHASDAGPPVIRRIARW
jgi:hypothetical protein